MGETVTWLTVPSWVRSAHCMCRNPVYQPVAASHEPLCPRGEALRDWQSLRDCRARLAALRAVLLAFALDLMPEEPGEAALLVDRFLAARAAAGGKGNG